MVSKSKSILVYCIVFAVGIAMIVLYVWWVTKASMIDPFYRFLLVDYALLAASTLAISFSRSMAVQIVLTLPSAVFGEIEGH